MKMKRLAILLLAAVLAFPLASCAKREPEALRIEDLFETVCPADEALALSRKANAVVLETRGCTSGKDVWDAFYQTAQSGAPASVLCAHYLTLDPAHMSEELYEREKDKYPRMQFYQVEYDGKEYSVKVRESTAQSPSDRENFPYLRHFTGEAPSSDARFASYDCYVLVDDPTVTWDGILSGTFSSQSDAKRYDFCVVYRDYSGWKEN